MPETIQNSFKTETIIDMNFPTFFAEWLRATFKNDKILLFTLYPEFERIQRLNGNKGLQAIVERHQKNLTLYA